MDGTEPPDDRAGIAYLTNELTRALTLLGSLPGLIGSIPDEVNGLLKDLILRGDEASRSILDTFDRIVGNAGDSE